MTLQMRIDAYFKMRRCGFGLSSVEILQKKHKFQVPDLLTTGKIDIYLIISRAFLRNIFLGYFALFCIEFTRFQENTFLYLNVGNLPSFFVW